MLNRKMVPICFFSALGLSFAVGAAPTQKDLDGVRMVFDYHAADDLAAFQMCGKPDLHNQYLQSMFDAGAAYPDRDPKKVTVLIRQIQRKADSLASMRTGFSEGSTQKEIDDECNFNIGQAMRHLKTLEDFIFKS